MVGLNVKGKKQHGMSDTRWDTFDKVTQFRDLIALEKRDSEVTRYQKEKIKRQEEKLLGELRKVAKQKQDELRNALLGNQNRMWTTLGEHRKIQLAQGRNKPEDVIENLYQMIDYKRKMNDKYHYVKLQLMEKYKHLVLKKGKQDELLLMQKSGIKSPSERKMSMVCLEKQNANMRRIAATSVRQSYTYILHILKKDAIYYDSVLDCLESDRYMQSEMLMSVTKMGQIVTEYLDDITQECTTLESGIKMNMREREKSLKQFRDVLTHMGKTFKQLIRSDSDIFVAAEADQATESKMKLFGELQRLDEILTTVQKIALVSGYEQIYPCMLLQQRQRERLDSFAKNLSALYHSMTKAKLHLEMILNLIAHTFNKDKIAYLQNKRDLLRGIRKNQKRISSKEDKAQEMNNTFSELRRSFKHIWQMLKRVRMPGDGDSIEILITNEAGSNNALQMVKQYQSTPVAIAGRNPISMIPPGENADELMDTVKRKIIILYEAFKPDGRLTRQAELSFSRAIMEVLDIVDEEKEVDLLEGLVIEDSRLPSHASVKAASAQYVIDNTVDELALVAAQVAARRKPGAYFRKLMKAEEKRRKANKCCGIY